MSDIETIKKLKNKELVPYCQDGKVIFAASNFNGSAENAFEIIGLQRAFQVAKNNAYKNTEAINVLRSALNPA